MYIHVLSLAGFRASTALLVSIQHYLQHMIKDRRPNESFVLQFSLVHEITCFMRVLPALSTLGNVVILDMCGQVCVL